VRVANRIRRDDAPREQFRHGALVAVGSDQGPRPSVVMACGGPADVAEGRWLLPDPVTAGTETFSAAVLEGAGTIRHPSYEVSIEQPVP
jgi:hypothetical protein